MSDYKGLRRVVEDGTEEKYDLLFQTIHRGLETRGRSIIFVDEFTSLPFEYLKMVAYLNGAEDIYIVGDDKQTHVREPEEGQYIGNHIDLSELPVHTICRNYRNPRDVVMLLNRLYQYDMEAMKTQERSIHIAKSLEELPDGLRALPYVEMAFSHTSCKAHNLKKSNSVRCYQGSTVDHAILYIDEHSGSTAASPRGAFESVEPPGG
jgi:hypothetical protein